MSFQLHPSMTTVCMNCPFGIILFKMSILALFPMFAKHPLTGLVNDTGNIFFRISLKKIESCSWST